MHEASQFLITLGGLLLLGLFTDVVGRRTFLPRITLLLVFGVIIGQEFLNLIPALFLDNFELIADMALLMIGFLLGGKLTIENISTSGNKIILISICAVIVPVILVTIGLVLLGVQLEVALLLGCVAAATDPAATVDTVMESGAKGPFTELLLAIVAIDDAWGLIVFSIGMAIVSGFIGVQIDESPFITATHEIGGAVILGLIIGFPAAYLTGRIKPGQPVLVEALGIVFICGGMAIFLEVSFLITAMVIGAVIANLARHHDYPFHAIEGIEWPFMIIFFTLAGASLEIQAMQTIGIIGLVFILCRILGKFIGAMIGSRLSKADQVTRRWIGLSLLPQAGVAMGMALVAANKFPEYRQLLLPVVVSTTIFFEIFGPIATRYSLNKVKAGK